MFDENSNYWYDQEYLTQENTHLKMKFKNNLTENLSTNSER